MQGTDKGKSHNVYPLLVDALRLLPGVAPVRAREALGQARHWATRTGVGEVNGVPASVAQLEQMFLHGEGGGPRISQQGAAFLLKLFREGVFERQDMRKVQDGVELLTAYAEGRASIIGPGYWPKRKRSAGTRREPRVVPATPPYTERTAVPERSFNRYSVIIHRLV